MAEFVGRADNYALFTSGEQGVVVDSTYSLIVASGKAEALLSSQNWADGEFSETDAELAGTALSSVVASSAPPTGRMYSIPRGVRLEAQKSLKIHEETGIGGSVIGIRTAALLAAGGQIDFLTVQSLSHYFEKHKPQKESVLAAFDPDLAPSVSKVNRGLRGGDAGDRWASAIVGREGVLSVEDEIIEIGNVMDDEPEIAPEFIARVRMDGSGIDRLYRVDLDGKSYVWDDGGWNDMEGAPENIWELDRVLDGDDDDVLKEHVTIDPASAVVISAMFQKDPFAPVSIEDIDSYESLLAADAGTDEDAAGEWASADFAMIAAVPAPDATPGVYSPDERSKNASKQVRDKSGKFATAGSRVVVNGDSKNAGAITKVNPADGTVTVKLDSGDTITVPGKSVENEEAFVPTIPGRPLQQSTVDTTGILGEPRTPINRTVAQLPGTLPAFTREDLTGLLNDWPAWVRAQREGFKGGQGTQKVGVKGKNSLDIGEHGRDLEKASGKNLILDAAEHPLVSKWLGYTDKKRKRPNSLWYDPITAAADVAPVAAPAKETAVSPDTSDVQPVYLAFVDADDPRAVLKLVSLVPYSDSSTGPMTYVREEGKWERNPAPLADLQSATPPPVVPLDGDMLNDVLKQVDSAQGAAPAEEPVAASAGLSFITLDHALTVLYGTNPKKLAEAMVAAGGLDRNRGGADKLRRYWTVGPGGAKIRWGSAGDWTRCVQHLGKYMGARAKGYCALRHKEMTGMWTGDKRHKQIFSRIGGESFSSDVIKTEDAIFEHAKLQARAADARARMSLVAGGLDSSIEPTEGARFRIPLIIPHDAESGDGRYVEEGALSFRDLPLPLMWQVKTDDGHAGSYVVGRIDHMELTPEGLGNAYGVFDVGPYGKEAERLVRSRFLRGVSADMDKFKASEEDVPPEAAEDGEEGGERMAIHKARVMGVTIVPKPAFQECQIFIDEGEMIPEEDYVIPDGTYVEDTDPIESAALIACGFVAGAIPMTPPTQWFDNPKLSKATPLTVADDGRVYGHIAAWHVDHIGMQFGTKPPRSRSNYAFFHTGVVRTEEGSDVPVGQLTLAGGHASLNASASEAVRHYDDTASAVADVHAGEDRHGIWVSGALRPGATPEQIRALRASAPSGDWRPIRGQLELVAVCQVNVPGFPVARARVASGHVMALVAAGAADLAKLKTDPYSEMSERIEKLEQFRSAEMTAQIEAARAKFSVVREIRDQKLADKAKAVSDRFSASTDFAFIPKAKRDKLASEGKALPDGSFPIENVSDLKKAIQAYGRAKNQTAARKHITKRARALGESKLIPEDWKNAASMSATAQLDRIRAKAEFASSEVDRKKLEELEKIARSRGLDVPEDDADPKAQTPTDSVAPESEEDKGIYTPETQPRDNTGRFRLVLARLRDNLGTSGNQAVLDKLEEVEGLDNTGNYEQAAKSAVDVIDLVDRIDSKALNPEALSNVRDATRALGEVIANLPLPFDNQAQKIRYSDLPPALRSLTENLIAKVENKIGDEEAQEATRELKAFMSGSDLYSQSDISAQLNRMLRLLT